MGWRLGVTLLWLPLLNTARVDDALTVASPTSGILIALLALTRRVWPASYLCEVEFFLGSAVAFIAIVPRQLSAGQCDWWSLAAGIAVMILATIADEFQGCAVQTSRCAILYSPQRDGSREWIWNALGIPPGRLLKVDFVERQLT